MNKLTPTQYIKREILKKATKFFEEFIITEDLETPEGIEAAYDRGDEEHYLQDARDEIRVSGITTDIPAGYSRYCEVKSVAKKMSDGQYVGWPYEYGGGKYFEESGNWLYDAYFVDCKEEEKMVTVRTFKKI